MLMGQTATEFMMLITDISTDIFQIQASSGLLLAPDCRSARQAKIFDHARSTFSCRALCRALMTSSDRNGVRHIGIASLPEDLLCKVFAHLSFEDKLQCQSICAQWSQALKHPCCEGLWGAVPCYTLDHCINPSIHIRERVQLYTNWLASRARGILTADIACLDRSHDMAIPGGDTKLNFFIQQQLPYLLGHMHLQNTYFDFSLTTGMCIVEAHALPCWRHTELKCEALLQMLRS